MHKNGRLKLIAIAESMIKTYSTAFTITIIPKLAGLSSSRRLLSDLKLILRDHLRAPLPIFLVQLFGSYQIFESIAISAAESKRNKPMTLHPKLKAFITKSAAFFGSGIAFYKVPTHMKLDLTLFALVRVLDHSSVGNHIERNSKLIFHFSSWIVMYCWFYYPNCLPKKYNHWISRIARIDRTLLLELRLVKAGTSNYGPGSLLPQSLRLLVQRFGASSSKACTMECPLPCNFVHEGIESCSFHILQVFIRAFKDGMTVPSFN